MRPHAQSPTARADGQEQSITMLRGLAVTLMVVGHVIGLNGARGLRVADESLWRYSYDCLDFLRMPLFSMIAGFLYAARPSTRDSFHRLVSSKARRLLVPLVTVSTFQYIVQALAPSANEPVSLARIWRIYLWPYDQFWFLYALFGIFVIVGALDAGGLLSTPRCWAMALWIAMAASAAWSAIKAPLGIAGLLKIIPYFLLGCGMGRFGLRLQSGWQAWLMAAIVVASFAFQRAVAAWHIPLAGVQVRLLALVLGLSVMPVLWYVRRPIPWLAWVGQYGYSIYLFHVFGTAGARIALRAAGVTDIWPLFLGSLAGGLALPIAVHQWLTRWSGTRKYVLGMKA